MNTDTEPPKPTEAGGSRVPGHTRVPHHVLEIAQIVAGPEHDKLVRWRATFGKAMGKTHAAMLWHERGGAA